MCIENKKTKFEKLKSKSLTSWRIDFVIIIFTLVLAYKLLGMDFSNIEIDIPTLLSICLAFFAIWLSIIFYFKADEANNRFYHHTYEFTKQTSEILGRLESGFGEKLDGVKENMKYFSNINPSELKKEKEKLEKELKEAKTKENNSKIKLEEAEMKIDNFIKKSNFNNKEKEEFLKQINQLKKLNETLRNNQAKVNQLNKKHNLPDNIILDFFKFLDNNFDIGIIQTLILNRNPISLLNYYNFFINANPNLSKFTYYGDKNFINRMIKLNYKEIFNKMKDYFYEGEEEEN